MIQSVLKQPRDAVYEIHDLLETYYSCAENRFIENVVKYGESIITSEIEESTFNKTWVESLSVDDLQNLVAEDRTTCQARQRLDKQIQKLEAAITHLETILPMSEHPTSQPASSNESLH